MFYDNELILRPIVKEDLQYLNKWRNDKNVFKYLGGGFSPVSIDQQETWIQNIINIDDKNNRFIIQVNDTPVGMIGLYNISLINRTSEIGLYIGEEEYRRGGYAGRAYKMIEIYARDYLNLRKINLFVVDDNRPAVSFWNKLNFKKVGCLHDERYIDGHYRDLLIMEKFI